MPSNDISVAGTTLHVEDTGGDGPPVICLHSLFMDGRMFDDFADAASRTYRVIRPDHRGQGRSAVGAADVITVEQCAGDIAALLDHLDVSGAHVVATSMGGDVALRLAVFRPDLVATLALLGTSARAEPSDQAAAFEAMNADVAANGFTGATLGFVSGIMFGTTSQQDPELASTIATWNERFASLPASLSAAAAGVMQRGDALPLLAHITIPSLVISGEECPVRPPEWARELAEGLPSSELVMLPGVGHSPLLEAPGIVTPKLLDLFATNPSRCPPVSI